MSWIKDLSELSPRIKNFIISMICLMPFWYICIYIFSPVIFFNSILYLTIPLAFCLSLLWYLVSLVLNIGTITFISLKLKINNTESDKDDFIILGGIDSVIYLLFAIILGLYSKAKYDAFGIQYHFTSFLWLSFFFSLVRAILIGIMMYIFQKSTLQTLPTQPKEVKSIQ